MQKLSQETGSFIGYLFANLDPLDIFFVKEMAHAELEFDYPLQNDLDVQLLHDFFMIFLHLLRSFKALVFPTQL